MGAESEAKVVEGGLCPRGSSPSPGLCAIWPATKTKSWQTTAGTKPEVGAILIEPDGMRQVGAEFAQHRTHPSQDKIALTAAAVAAMKRKPRRPGDIVRDAGLPVVR